MPMMPSTSTTSMGSASISAMKKALRSSARCGRLEADDAAAAALFQQDLEFADEVFRLFLDLDVAVADDPQHAAPLGDAVREQGIKEG